MYFISNKKGIAINESKKKLYLQPSNDTLFIFLRFPSPAKWLTTGLIDRSILLERTLNCPDNCMAIP